MYFIDFFKQLFAFKSNFLIYLIKFKGVMSVQKRILFFLTLILFFLVFASTAGAVTRFNAITFRPQTDDGPMWGLRQSQGLKQWQFNFGTMFDYAHRPLKAQIGALIRFNIIESLYIEHFYGAVGFTDWLEMSLSIPMVWHTSETNPDTLVGPTGHTDIGDFQLEFKGRILDNKNYPVGLAIAPFVTMPSGNENLFLGEDGFTGGGRVIVDGNVLRDRLFLVFNFGGVIRKKFNSYGVFLDDFLIIGGGAAVKIIEGLHISGEFEVQTPFSDAFSKKDSTPMDFRGGIKYKIRGTGLTVGAGGGGGLNFGGGTPKFRAMALVNFVTPVPEEEVKPVIDYADIESRVNSTYYFHSGAYGLTAEGVQNLTNVAALLRENPWITLVSVTGYTDTFGDKNFNMTLSRKRAKTVYDFLTDYGVSPSRLQLVNHGPIEGNPNIARRVEVRVVDSLQDPI